MVTPTVLVLLGIEGKMVDFLVAEGPVDLV